VAYSLATTIGGSTPVIVTYLIHETGNRAMPGAWLSVAAALAFLSVRLTRKQSNPNPATATQTRALDPGSSGSNHR
jgi:hypothetical protein